MIAASLVLFVLVAGITGTSLGLVAAKRATEVAQAEEVHVPGPADIALDYRLSIPAEEGSNGIVFGNGVPPWSWNLSRDGRILAIGRDREKKTVIVDTAVGGEIGFVADKRSALLPGNQPFVGGRNRNRVIAHDGGFMTSTDLQGEIKLWQLGTARALPFDRPKGPDGKVEIPERFKGPDGKFKVPDEREAKLPGTVVSPDGRHVATRTQFRKDAGTWRDYQVQFVIHDRTTGELVSTSPRYDARLIRDLRFDPDGRRVVGLVVKSIYRNPKQQSESEAEYTPTIWDAATGRELVKGKPVVAPSGSSWPNLPQLTVSGTGAVLVASFVPDGPTLSPHQQQGHWQIEELGSDRPPFALPRRSGRVFQFGPGAKFGVLLAQGGPNGRDVEIWDLEQRAILWTIPGGDNPHQTTHGVFSPDARRLFLFDGGDLGGSNPRQTRRSVAVSVWDIPGKRKIRTFNPPPEALTTWPRPIDREGSRVLCGTTVWNSTTGRELIQVSDGKLPNERRPRDLPASNPDYFNKLLAEAAERPGGIWNPARQIGSVLSEARIRLNEKSEKYDPAKAVELARQGLAAYPADRDATSVYGVALLRAGRPGEAIPVLEKALRIHDGPNAVKAGGHATCFHLALANHALGRAQDARARFAEGVARHVMLTADRESRPNQFRPAEGPPLEGPHDGMIEAAGRLGVAVPSLDLGAINRDSDVLLRECLIFRAVGYQLKGRTAEAVALAEECVANEPLTRVLAYNAACLFALAGQRAKADPAAQARYADRAVALLKKAAALGWDDVEYLKTDDDLSSLRGRDDYKALVAGLESKPPAPEIDPPRER